ncbi:hypothetical protein PIB30_045784 [Stylosanthes scabra]|uniref:Uncharacterized protein n=1 Tax=Stylosanthes scabra TaxID=79078 RepID=A0ABU6XGI7_9FABA|nr:hypothetical protein [Stylosanthes scabra]
MASMKKDNDESSVPASSSSLLSGQNQRAMGIAPMTANKATSTIHHIMIHCKLISSFCGPVLQASVTSQRRKDRHVKVDGRDRCVRRIHPMRFLSFPTHSRAQQ